MVICKWLHVSDGISCMKWREKWLLRFFSFSIDSKWNKSPDIGTNAKSIVFIIIQKSHSLFCTLLIMFSWIKARFAFDYGKMEGKKSPQDVGGCQNVRIAVLKKKKILRQFSFSSKTFKIFLFIQRSFNTTLLIKPLSSMLFLLKQ